MFQCSSASRKFLNNVTSVSSSACGACFSALQRAENSSISENPRTNLRLRRRFSALQRAENSSIHTPFQRQQRRRRVSVLFSEPKIPQSAFRVGDRGDGTRFSALQRAENSSIEKQRFGSRERENVSVLFSEPKIPQFLRNVDVFIYSPCFSALQRAENSSTDDPSSNRDTARTRFQCSSASRKFLNMLQWTG